MKFNLASLTLALLSAVHGDSTPAKASGHVDLFSDHGCRKFLATVHLRYGPSCGGGICRTPGLLFRSFNVTKFTPQQNFFYITSFSDTFCPSNAAEGGTPFAFDNIVGGCNIVAKGGGYDANGYSIRIESNSGP